MLALVLDALLVLADATIGQLAGIFVVTPLLLAVVAGPAITGAGAAVSIALGLASDAWNPDSSKAAYLTRVMVVALGGALAYYAAARRRSSDLEARRFEALAAIGDMVEASPIAVIGMEESGKVTLFNRAAERMFQCRRGDAVGRELAELIIPPELRDAHRAGLRRLRETGESQLVGRRLDLTGRRADGSEFPVAVTIAQLPVGGPAAFAGFIRDVTEEKRAERANLLRARTAELLTSAVDYEQTLREVAGLAVPELADRCWIEMPRANGQVVTVADSDSGFAGVGLMEPFEPFDEAQLREAGGVGSVIANGRPVLRPEVTPAWLRAYARDSAQLGHLEEAGTQAIMVVALKAGRRTIGTMTFITAESRRRYSKADLELAEELAARAGNAIDNARLYRERAHTAATLMAGLKPPPIPPLPGWSSAGLYRPAGRADEVGGDFYDVFPAGPGWMLVIGDVIGHGPPAAALTSLARYSIRTAGTLTGSPKRALEHLNAELGREGRLAMLTAVCLLIWETDEGGCAKITVAGHPRPILVRDGLPELIGHTSVVLGVSEDGEYSEDVLQLETGDCLLLYTDGVLDAASDTDRFGEERLLDALTGSVASPQAAIERVETALAGFETRPQRDDVAVLAVQRAGVSAGSGDASAHEKRRFRPAGVASRYH